MFIFSSLRKSPARHADAATGGSGRARASGRLRVTIATGLAIAIAGAGAGGAVASAQASGGGSAGSGGAKTAHAAKAKAKGYSYMTGIGDEQTEMFTNPLWTQLHTKIVRYIVPYDVVSHPYDLTLARTWIEDAEAAHQQILIAFYHSEYNPTKMPGLKTYDSDIKRFMKLFPKIKEYQPWDEANRGNEPHRFSSPSAVMAAKYYQQVIRACHTCTVVGLDVLDQASVGPTLKYIAEFKSEVRRLETVMPKVWGLHNYSDVNRLQNSRTRAIVRELPSNAQVWLTETGGIVKFGGAFPNKNGSGDRRAAKVLAYTFKVAGEFAKIKRLYVYQWTGSGPNAVFDAGLMDRFYHPRPAYLVICKHQHAAKCNQKTVHD